jgi:hypothetical protein
MNETATTGNQLWGIYHTDREYARELEDPLRTVNEAPTKPAAEEAPHDLASVIRGRIPITSEQATQAQWCSNTALSRSE